MDNLEQLPEGLKSLLVTPRTGAFVIGLLRENSIPVENINIILYLIVQVAFGRKRLADLRQLLVNENIQPDKAQAITTTLERDLFAPVMRELGEVQKRTERPPAAAKAMSVGPRSAGGGAPPLIKGEKSNLQRPELKGVPNVLDLKEQRKPPVPPPIPRK